jgi:hypothetical protein
MKKRIVVEKRTPPVAPCRLSETNAGAVCAANQGGAQTATFVVRSFSEESRPEKNGSNGLAQLAQHKADIMTELSLLSLPRGA